MSASVPPRPAQRRGRASRAKGAVGEREIVSILRAAYWPDAERTSNGRQQGHGDFANGPEAVYIEARRREKFSIWDSYAEADAKAPVGFLPVVAFRRSRSPWLCCLELDELLPLLRMRES